jgi:hypothetical protein
MTARESAPARSAEATDQAKEKAQQVVGQAQEKTQQVAGQAQEKAQEAAGQAKQRLAVEVDNRSTRAGEQLRSTAGDVRSVGEELRKQGKDKPAQLAERAAERVERVGGYLHESDGERILRDVEDLARRNTWAVATGGLVVGFLASRFLKASSSRRYESSVGGGRPYGTGYADQTPAWSSDVGVSVGYPPATSPGHGAPPAGGPGDIPPPAGPGYGAEPSIPPASGPSRGAL